MKTAIAILAALSMLTACEMPPQKTKEQVRAEIEKSCTGYGFKKGSDKFAECVMKVDLERKANEAAIDAAIASRPSSASTTSCRTYGTQTSCFTY
ncbi:MAG: hypothetical protein SFW64_03635 [Alphaproteobacteria bacterium]|nr:hypothetical protein [Alphaproteobacteria bacterium]